MEDIPMRREHYHHIHCNYFTIFTTERERESIHWILASMSCSIRNGINSCEIMKLPDDDLIELRTFFFKLMCNKYENCRTWLSIELWERRAMHKWPNYKQRHKFCSLLQFNFVCSVAEVATQKTSATSAVLHVGPKSPRHWRPLAKLCFTFTGLSVVFTILRIIAVVFCYDYYCRRCSSRLNRQSDHFPPPLIPLPSCSVHSNGRTQIAAMLLFFFVVVVDVSSRRNVSSRCYETTGKSFFK